MAAIGPMVLPRLGRAVLTMWLVVTVVFVFLRLSGDPVRFLLPANPPVEKVEALRAELGLDRSIPVQYVKYGEQLARGNFGDSLRFHRPAMGLVIDRFPATVQLALAAFAVAALFGVTIGSLAAYLRGSVWDRATMAVMSVLQSSPSFFLGIMLILVFSVHLRWLPTSGQGSFKQLLLPAITLSMPTMAALARMTRSALLDVLLADYIRTSRAKGLRERVIWLRHALRNASLPIVTVLGLELADLLTGAVIVETVFAWPGIGRLAVDAVSTRDYPVVQAAVVLIALVYLGINVLLDLSYPLLDPRVRRG
jgi:ABC-type dipeptide/oligopeptide/nickel transport system permease component